MTQKRQLLVGFSLLVIVGATTGYAGSTGIKTAKRVNGNTRQAAGTDAKSPHKGAEQTTTIVGTSCKGDDPDHLCLAIKYAVYQDENGKDVVSSTTAAENMDTINKIWSQCNLGFQIDKFYEVKPGERGLELDPADTSELTQIRGGLEENDTLLVVTTGEWNRTGSLGFTAANAWTSMPGEIPYGAVLEQPVGKFGNIVGHELGHYLGLPHVGDAGELMNPIIYDDSTRISSYECDTARQVAGSDWSKMLR